jgi:hypothetical protein
MKSLAPSDLVKKGECVGDWIYCDIVDERNNIVQHLKKRHPICRAMVPSALPKEVREEVIFLV